MKINWYILALSGLITASGAGTLDGPIELLGSIFGVYICLWAILWTGARITRIFQKKKRDGSG